jgi:hypothetical protein
LGKARAARGTIVSDQLTMWIDLRVEPERSIVMRGALCG